MTRPSLATSPEYLDHAIAALRVVTQAEPLAYMDKFPYPGPSAPSEPRIDKPVQLDLFGGVA